MDPVTWVDVITVATGFFATMTAVIGLVVALRSDRRSREALRVQTYLQLRTRFLDIYRELGRLEDAGDEGSEARLTRQAYWHHAWDEWYITKELAPREFATLWDDFFSKAMAPSAGHPGLWAALEQLASNPRAGFGAYARDLIKEVRTMKGDPGNRARTDIT
jgi:hypothetical protein